MDDRVKSLGISGSFPAQEAEILSQLVSAKNALKSYLYLSFTSLVEQEYEMLRNIIGSRAWLTQVTIAK